MTQLMTAAEVAACTGLDEKRVRKDVEHGVVGTATPPRFGFAAVVYFRAMALLDLHSGPPTASACTASSPRRSTRGR